MKDFLELAKKRKTTFEFSNKSVSDKDIHKLLEAARWAPNCTNIQPWHFIVVRNKEIIENLMKQVNYGFFHESPAVLIACVLVSKRCMGPNHACFRGINSTIHDAFMSVGIAANNICLEAEDLGISSCLLTPYQEETKRILKVSKEDAIPLIVGLGYEKKGAFKRKRERLELKKIVSYESFGAYNGKHKGK